jgi:hypothetical protein
LPNAVRVQVVVAFILASLACPVSAQVQPSPAPSPSASPSASASPAAGPADPCTSILALVNRPTITTGSCVFKNGKGDVETGYTNTVTTGAGAGITVAYPQAFVRVGTVIHNVELDVTPPGVLRASSGSSVITGTGDAAIGAKWEIGYSNKAIYSIDASSTLPSGDRAFTAGGSTYTAALNAAYAVNPVFTLAASLETQSLAAQGRGTTILRQGAFVPSLELSAALPASSQLYAEISNFSHAGVGLPARTLYDFGFQKQLSTHWVLDLETGLAPTPAAGQQEHYLGFGVTYGNV